MGTDPFRIPAEIITLAPELQQDWRPWLAAIRATGVPMNSFTNLTDRTDADALIPEEDAREIIQGLPSASAALSLMRRRTMSRKRARMPVLDMLPQAFWVSGDTGLKSTTKLEWGRKYLEAEELAVIVPLPDAVKDDSDYDIWEEAKPLLVEAFGAKIDAAAFFADEQPPGWDDAIVPGAAAAGNEVIRGAVAGQDIAGDIGAEGGVMALVEDDGFGVNGFAGKTGLRAAFRGLRDENGGLLFQPSLQAGTPSTLYGQPMYYPDGNGAWEDEEVELIGGDWSKAILGVRQDITYKVFTEGVLSDSDGRVVLNLMQQDSAALRAVIRVGFCIANPINRKNQDARRRFPFSVLRPRGFTP